MLPGKACQVPYQHSSKTRRKLLLIVQHKSTLLTDFERDSPSTSRYRKPSSCKPWELLELGILDISTSALFPRSPFPCLELSYANTGLLCTPSPSGLAAPAEVHQSLLSSTAFLALSCQLDVGMILCLISTAFVRVLTVQHHCKLF